MSEDIKNAITDLGRTFEEFKKVNDQRLEQIEKGESTALVDEKLALSLNSASSQRSLTNRFAAGFSFPVVGSTRFASATS